MNLDSPPKAGVPGASSYRPEIDGLRALAILVVVGFHAFPTVVPSGFVGVDVFFVVSGYLISKIILGELEQGNFSFMNFYSRRIRRIFPALTLVLIAVYGFGWLSLFAEEFRVLAEHIFAGASFIINIVLMRQLGYFDTAAHTKPLLHLWSLAVEEQFYLVWPLLLWWTARMRLSAFWPILVLCVASFAINIILLHHRSLFFSPVTRFWELMLGSVLAFLALNEADYSAIARLRSRRLQLAQNVSVDLIDLAAWLGVVLIVVSVWFALITKFPGWWALLPTVGTCLVIFAGPGAWLNRAVFSNAVLVGIGLISYPLYLWHWPILSFISIVRGNSGPAALRMAAVLAAFGLAALTYFLVERPIRFGAHRNLKTAALAVTLLCVGCLGTATYALQGIPSRYAARANLSTSNDLAVPTSSRLSDSSCPRLLDIAPDPDEVCLGNAVDPRLLVLGDSTAMAFNSAAYDGPVDLKTALVSSHAHIWAETECMAERPFEEWLRIGKTCADIADHAFRIAKERQTMDAAVISFAVEDQFTYQRDKLLGIQKSLLNLRKKVIYLIVPPLFHIEPSSCVARVTALGVFTRTSKSCVQDRAKLENDQRPYRAYIESLKAADSGVLVYDSLDALCDEHSCSIDDDLGPMYFIDGHVNPRGSARLLSGFLKWYKGLGSGPGGDLIPGRP
jgi:peptidoglycan/LPS O-acetylase OafA/YrhL